MGATVPVVDIWRVEDQGRDLFISIMEVRLLVNTVNVHEFEDITMVVIGF